MAKHIYLRALAVADNSSPNSWIMKQLSPSSHTKPYKLRRNIPLGADRRVQVKCSKIQQSIMGCLCAQWNQPITSFTRSDWSVENIYKFLRVKCSFMWGTWINKNCYFSLHTHMHVHAVHWICVSSWNVRTSTDRLTQSTKQFMWMSI